MVEVQRFSVVLALSRAEIVGNSVVVASIEVVVSVVTIVSVVSIISAEVDWADVAVSVVVVFSMNVVSPVETAASWGASLPVDALISPVSAGAVVSLNTAVSDNVVASVRISIALVVVVEGPNVAVSSKISLVGLLEKVETSITISSEETVESIVAVRSERLEPGAVGWSKVVAEEALIPEDIVSTESVEVGCSVEDATSTSSSVDLK